MAFIKAQKKMAVFAIEKKTETWYHNCVSGSCSLDGKRDTRKIAAIQAKIRRF